MTPTPTARSVAATAGLLSGVTILARIIGFSRWIVFSGALGATAVGTVYQSVNTIPNVVFEIAAGGVLAAVVVPLLASRVADGVRGRDGGSEADEIASALLTWAVLLLLPLAVLVAVLARPLTTMLLGDGAVPADVDLGVDLLVLFAPQIVLYGIGIVMAGVLQAHRRFLAAALTPLASSLVVIAVYLAYGRIVPAGTSSGDLRTSARWLLGLGTTAGVIALSLPLLLVAARIGIRLRPRLSFPPGVAARARSLAGAGLLALVAQQISVVVTMVLANSRGGVGALNVQQYAQAVYLLPYAVLAVPVATSAFPALAESGGRSEAHEAGAATLARSARAITALCLLAAAVLIVVSRPVGAFFTAMDRGRDHGGGEALGGMADALAWYAPGLVGFGIAALLTRALYAHGRPAHAALAVGAGWLVATVWPVVLLAPHAGPAATLRTLAVGWTIGMTLSGLLLVLLVRRSWGAAALAGLGRTSLAAAAGAAVGTVALRAVEGRWATAGLLAPVLEGIVLAVAVLVVAAGILLVLDPSSAQALRRLRPGGRS
ncbi:murein biosynthesis integral membrane protein MurJ [Janibacter sp. G56]|uniref:murein biosynthesis integral membrane protein MurJ n=1 Tax=Janibacter sp. G56 TaxID=3418717 RepID=UPI003D012C69